MSLHASINRCLSNVQIRHFFCDFWELPEPGVLCPPPEDNSDILSPTRQRREREEYAGGTWDE